MTIPVERYCKRFSMVMMIFVLQDGWSLLMRASSEGHLNVVKSLIEAGANVNQADKVGIYTPTLILWIVAMAACHPAHINTCR